METRFAFRVYAIESAELERIVEKKLRYSNR